MNGWLVAAAVLLAGGLGAAVWGVATGPLGRRVVTQNMTTSLVCVAVLLLAQGYRRPAYVDIGLELSLLGPIGTLVYARLLADDLRPDPPRAPRLTAVAAAGTAAVVIALAVASGPGRAAVKLLLVGALLITGNVVASRALAGGIPEEARHE
ncbi:hypothetical protein GCM10018793_11880 [Streptomyces sulfonofaciens]|uniref:Multisubunit sodium/proton antiporter MrpF subunit n=1 Tax=Streptomyces sulfonofaciens TaxID=68272 RepID=A0A919FVN9_9ACTN|nr:monovalent cation/H+ antiporter complex subunit F [Streptomyces sulfonofaciens]GHH73322.1 hypothetical protein GCM10018793_11880 [Streptomyces sulfonofaciens]